MQGEAADARAQEGMAGTQASLYACSGLVLPLASQKLVGFHTNDYFWRSLKLMTALKWLG